MLTDEKLRHIRRVLRSQGEQRSHVKPYPPYPFLAVTSCGRVFDCRPDIPREISQSPNKDGYPRVSWRLQHDPDRRCYHAPVHRMVALAHLPNPEGFPIVRHLDGKRTNARLSNLAWGTAKQNAHDTVRHMREQGRHTRLALTPEKAATLRRLRVLGATCKELALLMDITPRHMQRLLAGKCF